MEEKFLAGMGLNSKEIAVYQVILKNSSATPVTIARTTVIKRTTAYGIARGLAERGFVVEDATRRPRIFAPARPEQVLGLIEEERSRLTEKEGKLKNLAEELSKISAGRKYPVPTVRFIEEQKIGQFMRDQIPEWCQSILATDSIWWGFQDH